MTGEARGRQGSPEHGHGRASLPARVVGRCGVDSAGFGPTSCLVSGGGGSESSVQFKAGLRFLVTRAPVSTRCCKEIMGQFVACLFTIIIEAKG
jgi:hypothetical protein